MWGWGGGLGDVGQEDMEKVKISIQRHSATRQLGDLFLFLIIFYSVRLLLLGLGIVFPATPPFSRTP